MKPLLLVSAVVVGMTLGMAVAQRATAEPEVRIQPGADYHRYSGPDLQLRVWDLERAVVQLQARVQRLENPGAAQPPPETWLCTVEAKSEKYTGIGAAKAVAAQRALAACKEANGGNTFFCGEPKCSQ